MNFEIDRSDHPSVDTASRAFLGESKPQPMDTFQLKAAGEEKKQTAAAIEAAQSRAMYRGKVSI
jgi:hypothetical protein